MSDNVVKLEVVEVGENHRFEAAQLFDAAKTYDFERMAIIGRLENGEIYVAGTANAGETMVLLKQAEHYIVFGRDGVKE